MEQYDKKKGIDCGCVQKSLRWNKYPERKFTSSSSYEPVLSIHCWTALNLEAGVE